MFFYYYYYFTFNKSYQTLFCVTVLHSAGDARGHHDDKMHLLTSSLVVDCCVTSLCNLLLTRCHKNLDYKEVLL